MSEKRAVLAFWKNYDRKMYLKAAQLADELGYDSFWVPEAWGYEIFQLLTEMAVHTKNIKLGTGIVNVFSRSPGLIAMSAATLDDISEGRLILGIGTSGKRVIEGFHARAYDKPLTQLNDVIRVTRALLAGDNLIDAGAKMNEYRPFTLAMEPVRRNIPIYVAALKERSIRSIGEMADGWIPTMWPFDKMEVAREWIAEGARKAGRDPSAIQTTPFTIVVPMGGAALHQAKKVIAFYIAGMGDYYKELLTGFGYGETCDRIVELYRDKATRKQATDAVSDEMVEALTIAGEPQDCLEKLRRLDEYGVDMPIVCLPPEAPWPLQEMFLRGLAPNQ
jgi:alkanesulfonate monooxygenase SsuD/methylene tetrahydromethanopterin reductase-like flavin-dependent oxidoreductase (luciferase family)